MIDARNNKEEMPVFLAALNDHKEALISFTCTLISSRPYKRTKALFGIKY